MVAPSINDYALLGDCQGAALVSRSGSIDWWCAPRFDSRSCFARLLDPAAGHWSIRPDGAFTTERAYAPDTMVLRTTFRTPDGDVRLSDALAFAPGARTHAIGLDSPHVLVRVVEGLSGTVALRWALVPRLEYGLVVPAVRAHDGGLATVGGPDTLRLTGDLEQLDLGEPGSARGELLLRAGQSVAWALRHDAGLGATPGADLDPRAAVDDTIAGWRSWAAQHTAYDGPYPAEVRRSSLVLQALTYAPSGAMVAAPTTSLPELVGGEANWDYRYAWLRDASLALKALWVSACPDEARHYFDWMARAAAGNEHEHVQIMFGVEGERDLSERTLEHLAGYRDSRPVRVGNAAWSQRQLDVYGEVLEAAHLLRDRLDGIEPETAAFLCSLAERAARTWREPDAGIWEGREGERHYLSSKLMCWVALDRAVLMADRLGPGARPDTWAREREAVRAAILDQGFHAGEQAFTGAFGSHHHDASVLLIPIVGFLPAADPRMRSTTAAIQRELGDGGVVRRWTGADEGGFVICSFWLAEVLALGGEPEAARAVFDAVAAQGNDVGLLAEELGAGAGELVGNFPQAFSHVGLINAAWAIGQAER